MRDLVAGCFVLFWTTTLFEGAVSRDWYWRRALVVLAYLPLVIWPAIPRVPYGIQAMADSLVLVHGMWMLVHFLYGDPRMWGNDGR